MSILNSQNEGDILEDHKSVMEPRTWPDKKVPYIIVPNNYGKIINETFNPFINACLFRHNRKQNYFGSDEIN